jgi:predicted small lipoprotein YifL
MADELRYKRPEIWRMDGRMTGRFYLVVVFFAVIGAVAGCGRKVGLDTPYEAAIQARKDAEKAKQPLPPEPAPPVQDRRFILDRLIE